MFSGNEFSDAIPSPFHVEYVPLLDSSRVGSSARAIRQETETVLQETNIVDARALRQETERGLQETNIVDARALRQETERVLQETNIKGFCRKLMLEVSAGNLKGSAGNKYYY